MTWFEVDRQGLAAMLQRRSKAFIVFELVQNAWDSGAVQVNVTLEPVAGAALATLEVTDDSPEGWGDLADAFTMFGQSRRGNDPDRRGRFCLGEKLVLAVCREARIETMSGTVEFLPDGSRRVLSFKRPAGTRFTGTLRLPRDEIAEIEAAAGRLIAPVATVFNGVALGVPRLLGKFEARLPTEIQDAEGNLRRSIRQTQVEAYEGDGGGEILELGIPVCTADWPWRLNVLQKVPLGMDRDAVPDAFRRALQVAALNALSAHVDAEQAAAPWASEAIGDARVRPEALNRVIRQRFGERAVIATPGDPIANASAEANGCSVIRGGALSADAWANVRKHAIILTTSQAFPTPKPAAVGEAVRTCPLCKQPIAR